MQTSTVNYLNYGKCLKLENKTTEVLITLDLGPRIIGYNLKDKPNMMWNDVERTGAQSGEHFDKYFFKGATWYSYGGHRLWTSPESSPETYYPDNDPVQYVIDGNTVTLTPPPQKSNNLQHVISLTLDENTSKVTLTQKVINVGKESQKISVWGLTVLDIGGTEIIPHNTKDTGLLQNRLISVWPYDDMTDSRINWGNKYITLYADKNAAGPFKIGTNNQSGWGAYLNHSQLFVKHFPHIEGEEYPDYGCSFETYTCSQFLELETLSPLKTVAKGDSITHVETWKLFPVEDTILSEQVIKELQDKYVD